MSERACVLTVPGTVMCPVCVPAPPGVFLPASFGRCTGTARVFGTEMGHPWTAAQAASDDVSKKMLIQYLQEHAEATFVTENKLNGVITAVVTRVTKEQLVEMYEKHISSGVDACAPTKAEAAGQSETTLALPPAASTVSAAQGASASAARSGAPPSLPPSVPMPGREAVETFLRRLNPVAYGSPGERPTPAQSSALDDAANGLGAMISSAAGPDGLLPRDACPLDWTDEDPRNVWALAGRLAARTRTVELPLLGLSATLQQRWREDDIGDDECEIESHSTAAACWDGAVVLADLLCLPPPVLLAHSTFMARSVASYAGWRWADKSVLELGCGIGALPALVTALLGARRVLCTDGHASVLRMTRANIAQWVSEHPRVTPPVALRLLWGDGEHVRGQLRAAGLPEAPFDVILAADCLYVLENPGAWGKFLSTVVALSTPETLVFVTYTDRGHNALWERFVSQRVRRHFDVVAVGSHLLHPAAQPGAPGRLEHHHPACQVFCWALKDAASPTESG